MAIYFDKLRCVPYFTYYFGDHYEVKGGTVYKYIFAGNLRVAQLVGGGNTVSYFHKDHLGSSTVMTDSSGSVLGTSNYEPFGGIRSGSVSSSYKFTEQELDGESGLYNYGARLYDPIIGRFISPDTIVPQPYNPQSLNRYTYCLNNPLIYVDPSGNITETGPGEFTLDEITVTADRYNEHDWGKLYYDTNAYWWYFYYCVYSNWVTFTSTDGNNNNGNDTNTNPAQNGTENEVETGQQELEQLTPTEPVVQAPNDEDSVPGDETLGEVIEIKPKYKDYEWYDLRRYLEPMHQGIREEAVKVPMGLRVWAGSEVMLGGSIVVEGGAAIVVLGAPTGYGNILTIPVGGAIIAIGVETIKIGYIVATADGGER